MFWPYRDLSKKRQKLSDTQQNLTHDQTDHPTALWAGGHHLELKALAKRRLPSERKATTQGIEPE